MEDNKIVDKLTKSIKNEATFNRKVTEVADKIDAMKKGPIAEIWTKVQKLWKIVQDKSIPWYDKIIPLVALLYLVMPADLIPDVIPGVGLTDDLGVILVAVAAIADVTQKSKKK